MIVRLPLGAVFVSALLLAPRVFAASPGDDPSSLSPPWQPLGPFQESTASYGNVTGRVSSIAADPSDATGGTVYIGTTGGGVWKSVNAAGPATSVSFQPLMDDLPAFSSGATASLSIGAVSVQPGGTGVVLAGTGDPNGALDSYYGTGLLRSADGGLTWSLIAQSRDSAVNSITNYSFFGLAFAGFAWSTQNTDLVVAAVSQSTEGVLTGANQRETAASLQTSVMGLYYSTDAGQTWLLATITDGSNQNVQTSLVPVGGGGNAATAVVWNPIRKRFYAAVRFHGYYESTDGITWTRLAHQPGTGLSRTECPTQPNTVGSPACPIFRGALAVQPASGDLFALTVDINLLDQGLWRDECSLVSGACASSTVAFGQQLPTAALEDGSGGIELGSYSLWLAAVPSAGDTLLLAGSTDVFRCSLADGCAFRNTTNTETCAAARVAPFQHTVDTTFAATLATIYFGNDSGLWRSTDNVNQTQPPCNADDANHYQNLNAGLGSLAEVVAFSQDPANGGVLLAGLGVNGTAAAASGETVWPQVLGGYGSFTAIDPANSNNWYAQSSAGVGIDVCTSGAVCNSAAFGTPVIGYPQVGEEAYSSFQPAPFLLDPQGSGNLILGTCHVWRGPASGLSWSAADLLGDLYPGEGPECAGNAWIQSLAASGTVSSPTGGVELIYAGMAGIGISGPQAYAGHLFAAAVSAAAPVPGSWRDLWLSPVRNGLEGFNPQDYSVSSVIVDPHDPTGQTIYATIDGFDTSVASTPSVYLSTNGGVSWLNIRSNLPGVPANSIAVDPNDANTVYVALDTGVYVTTAVAKCTTQNCWSVYGTGLPNSPVVQLSTFNGGGQSLLRAGTYGRGIWQTSLVTAAATATRVTVAPAALTFAPQAVQTQSAQETVTVTNSGSIAMVVSQVKVGGDFAETDDCSSPVAVGANCTVQVTFTPTATGTRTGTLTVYANIAGGQATLPISGTGNPGAAIVLLPTAVSFGTSQIGVATALAQNLTISNTGGVAVGLHPPTATGDFSIVANTCPASLAPQFGCTVALRFIPTASGSRTGVFSITDDVGTQIATLSGTGLAPATDVVSPSTLAFAAQVVGTASPAQAVTMTNSGDSPLNSIAVAVAGDFAAVDGCGNSLMGHASCSINVKYIPTAVGAESGTLTINDMYGRPQAITLTGSGLASAGVSALPKAVDFADWGVAATSAPQAVTVTNNGGVALNTLSFAVSGDFAVSANSCPAVLGIGASCTAQIVFTPSQPGPRMGSLAISSSSLTNPLQVTLSGIGLAFTFQANGATSATIAAGQTANYLLRVDPATGSSGELAFTCTGAPQNSTCTVNPATLQLASGVTATVAVTIATVASGSLMAPEGGGQGITLAVLLPAGLFLAVYRWPRRRAVPLAGILLLGSLLALSVSLGCGVTSSGGKSSATTGGPPTGTPSATYNPMITASAPGISQTVQLTLIVD